MLAAVAAARGSGPGCAALAFRCARRCGDGIGTGNIGPRCRAGFDPLRGIEQGTGQRNPMKFRVGIYTKKLSIVSPNPNHSISKELRDSLFMQTYLMMSSCNQYAASVELLEFSRQLKANAKDKDDRDLPNQWSTISGREAVLSARNFHEAIKRVKNISKSVPEWASIIDNNAIKIAVKRFESAFPGIKPMRDAIAHPEEYANPRGNDAVSGNVDGMAINMGSDSKVTIMDSWKGGIYICTHDGQALECEVSFEKARLICSLTEFVFSELDKI